MPHTSNVIIPLNHSTLNQEVIRRLTFAKWPLKFIDPDVLAMTGFYFVGPNDTVRCHFCNIEINKWVLGDNIVTEHKLHSRNCPLIRRRQTNNDPIDADLLGKTLPPISYDVCCLTKNASRDVCGINREIRQNTISEGSFEIICQPRKAVSLERKPAEHPQYATEAARLKSYVNWPKTTKKNPQELIDAGFFYTSKGDRVKCFSCGIGLRDWDENDEPWEQHALWGSTCEYLKLIKGPTFIAAVLEASKKRKEEALKTKSVAVPNESDM